MRRTVQLTHSNRRIGRHVSPVPYICSSCRRQAHHRPPPSLQQNRNASSGLPWTERLRRKIWGTDNPPGLKDPYGGPGYFERRRQRVGQGQEQSPPATDHPDAMALDTEPALAPPYTTVVAEEYFPSKSVVLSDPEKEDSNYIPAETWDGLDRVGSSGHWKEQTPRLEEVFRPFLATYEKATTREEVLSCLHQAAVEVATLFDTSSPVSADLANVTYTLEVVEAIANTTIELDVTGQHIELNYKGGKEAIQKAVKDSLAIDQDLHNPGGEGERQFVEDSAAGEDFDTEASSLPQATSAALGQEVRQTPSATGDVEHLGNENELSHGSELQDYVPQRHIAYPVSSLDFLALPVESPQLRFSIFKRVSQLTCHRIPDPVLTSSRTLMPIFNYLLRESNPKPKRLADRLVTKQDLVGLTNVHIMTRRETSVDKDKQLGRWKIIEAELQSKGLPVFTSRSRAQRMN